MNKTKLSANLLAEANRGLLLDLVVFVLNIFLMRLLSGIFIDLFKAVSKENPLAKFLLSLVCLALWILPAAGAVLKRWSFHRRTQPAQSALAGCFFNPIFYFCTNLVIMSAIVAALGDFLLGNKPLDTAAVFIPSIFLGLALTIFQTYLIYQYFSPPKKPPRWKFLMRPEAATLGDLCFFLNMILFQVGWNILTSAPLGRVSGPAEFLGRLFFLCFIALLIYFPPRMFYLAEDINRPRTWLTMLLAISPVIVRVLIGTTPGSDF